MELVTGITRLSNLSTSKTTPVKLLPVRPSLPRCPCCKAFMGINPVDEWSRCNSCGTSFFDLDSRRAVASALAADTRRAETIALSSAQGGACQSGPGGDALEYLQPSGKIIIKKTNKQKLTQHNQLDFFGELS